jgi:hypothetical protein
VRLVEGTASLSGLGTQSGVRDQALERIACCTDVAGGNDKARAASAEDVRDFTSGGADVQHRSARGEQSVDLAWDE